MENEPIIGVVGGMGPFAGLDLVSKIFNETVACTDQDHIPVALLSYGHKIQDRSAYVLGRVQDNPGHAIAEVAMALEALGATVAGIPCNSAHMPPIFGVVMARLRVGGHRIQMLHLIKETLRYVRERLPHVQYVGSLSTLGTFRLGVYEKAIKSAGLRPIMPTEEVQDTLVHRAIYDPEWGIKAQSAPVSARASAMVQEAMQHLARRGAEAIILGCTELPLVVADGVDAAVIDPARALARALIRKTYPDKLRPLKDNP